MRSDKQKLTKSSPNQSIFALIGLSSLLFVTSCGSTRGDQKDNLRETLLSTWIYVEDDMFRPETASQFFPKLNDLIRDAKPKRSIVIYVSSDFLPQMVTDKAHDPLDPFVESQKKTHAENVPVISSGRAMPVYDLLKLLCDVTGTQLVIEKDKVLIAPGACNKNFSKESNQSILGTR